MRYSLRYWDKLGGRRGSQTHLPPGSDPGALFGELAASEKIGALGRIRTYIIQRS